MEAKDTYTKNIGFVGGVSLLMSSITGILYLTIGPGMLTIPIMFQQAGWLLPMIALIICPLLGTLASLFLMESMTYFPDSPNFERSTEITVLVHHFYGRRWYYLTHFILYGSLQSFNIASIISGIQQFDQLLVQAAGATCGFGIAPKSGWYCVSSWNLGVSPFEYK